MGDADHMIDGGMNNNDDGRLMEEQHNDNEPQKIFSFDDNKNMTMGLTGDANVMRQ